MIALVCPSRFPELFARPYTPEVYNATATRKLRAQQSAAAFLLGAFEGTGPLGACGVEPGVVRPGGRVGF